MEQQKKFKISTLGCRTNQYESAAYAKQLRQMGYVEAKENEIADICIVNTCTVTEGADKSSRHQIRHLAKNQPAAKLVVTGCLAERLPSEISGIEGVDLVVPNKEKESLLKFAMPEESLPEFSIDQFGSHTRAFVKVQDGCNSFCTYCIIPYVRGRSRSRSVDSILKEIQDLIANNYKEVVITGINVGDFDGGEEKTTLAHLIRLVDQLDGLKRLRLSSIDPDEVNDDLLDAIISGKNTCPSMHIVLQSGSNAVLKKMNRKYTKQMFLESIRKLKSASSDFTFTTDVIVGFPGETEEDFEETLEVMRKAKFAKVHMFPFSPRDRTRAALYPNQVPSYVIQKRKQEVLRLAEQIAFELREEYIGRTVSVLTENLDPDQPHYISGHTNNFLPVMIPAHSLTANEIINVKCLENTPTGLIGCILK